MRNAAKAYEGGYESLELPVKKLMAALGKAMWHFARIKEITWYQWGLEAITASIHKLEHDCGEYIDRLKMVLTQEGLPLPYPSIPEYDSEPQNVVDAFNDCIDLIDEVNAALSEFIDATDNDYWEPLARQAEEIQVINFKPKAWLNQTKVMAENGESMASLDKWFNEFFGATKKQEIRF